MMNLRKPIAGITILALSACMGGGEDGLDEGLIVSSGLLELVLPDEESREELPGGLFKTVSLIESLNETGVVDTAPTGGTLYSGSFAVGFGGGDEILTGRTSIEVGFSDSEVAYNFSAQQIYGVDGEIDVSGGFGGDGVHSGGFYGGDIEGTVNLESIDGTESFNFDGSIDGVFVEDGRTIGQLDGTISGDSDDEFSGIFLAFEAP